MKKPNKKSEPTTLHLGCGMRRKPNSLGVDINPNTALYNRHRYSQKEFKKIKVIVGPQNPTNLILILTLKLINKYLEFYERRLAFIFPVGAICIELEVVKDK